MANSYAGEITGTATSAAVFSNMPIDVREMEEISVQLTGTWVGTVTFQGSNDGTNYFSVTAASISSSTTIGATTTANGAFHIPVNFSYFRLNCTAYTSGTITATIELFKTSTGAIFTSSGGGGGGEVTNAGTFVVQINGDALTSLQLMDDSTGTVGSAVPTKAQVAGGSDGTNNRILKTNTSGELQVGVVVAGTAAISSGVNGSKASGGDTAHDAADAGFPMKVGGQARTTNPTAVADADRVNFIADKLGKQIVVGAIRDLKGVQNTTITSSTSETTIVTAVASTFLDLYGLIIANTSATACEVTIKDATAGTTRCSFEVPATDTRGFMVPVDSGMPQAAVNNNWTATCGTSVASIKITALYVKNI